MISISKFDALSSSNTATRLGNPAKKPRIVLKAILKPLVLAGEPDEHPGRLAVPRDDDHFVLRIMEMSEEIVFSLVQRDSFHCWRPVPAAHSPWIRAASIKASKNFRITEEWLTIRSGCHCTPRAKG